MNKSKGAMGVGLMVGLALIGLMITIGGAGMISYYSASNYAVRAEADLAATWTNNQNILGQYTIKVQEVASIPAMYKDDLKEVMAKELSSRYGAQGSQANMQWIKEHSVNFDSSLYTKIQQVIEAGRNEFQNAQTRLIDQKRVYVTSLGTVPRSWFLSMAGFPKVDLSMYKPVVASDTAEAFKSGVSAPIKMR
jgi:hypothetical protein